MRRREFLALPAAAPLLPAESPTDAVWRNKQPAMTYRRLGRTGFMVSSVGMGGDDIRPDNNDHVLWAVDQGLNYFDTAPNYGNGLSEKGYAAVLKARGRENLFQVSKVNIFPKRTNLYQQIFRSLPADEQAALRQRVTQLIQEKGLEQGDYLGNYFSGQATVLRTTVLANLLSEKYGEKIDRPKEYKQYILDSVEGSLKALGTDYLDCLLMRGVETPHELKSTPEVLEAFEILKKQGKARFLGFSAHSDPAGVLNAAIDMGGYAMGMVAYHFLNHKWMAPVLEKAKKADFGVMAMKASRVVQNPYNRRQVVPERARALDAAVAGNMTVYQKGFHFVLQNPNLSGVVIGMLDMAQAKEDVPLAKTQS